MIPLMNEGPTCPVALLIRDWGTDARAGINSRVEVLGDKPRSYGWWTCALYFVEKDSLAGVKGGGGRAERRSKF